MLSAILAAANLGSQIYSGISARRGQERANQQGMEFNSSEAQTQRDWEERMFGSRYQMTRRDLEAAGYNPMLAFGSGPGVPSGVAAHFEPKSTTAESSKIFANTAKSALDMTLGKAMLNKTNAEASSAKALAALHQQNAEIATSPMGKFLAQYRYFLDQSGVGTAAGKIFDFFTAKNLRGLFAPAPRKNLSKRTSYDRRGRELGSISFDYQ